MTRPMGQPAPSHTTSAPFSSCSLMVTLTKKSRKKCWAVCVKYMWCHLALPMGDHDLKASSGGSKPPANTELNCQGSMGPLNTENVGHWSARPGGESWAPHGSGGPRDAIAVVLTLALPWPLRITPTLGGTQHMMGLCLCLAPASLCDSRQLLLSNLS